MQELDLDDDSEELDEEHEPVEGSDEDEDDDSLIRSCMRCGASGAHGGLCQRCVLRGQLLNRPKKASEPVKEETKKAASIPVVKAEKPVTKPAETAHKCVKCGAKFTVSKFAKARFHPDHCRLCANAMRTCEKRETSKTVPYVDTKPEFVPYQFYGAVENPKPVAATVPLADVAARMVEACTIVDAIGWDLARQMVARIGGTK